MREYPADWEALKATDPEVADAIANELQRERTNLRLIASENYASPAVLAALGSTMTDKYAEGYPGRRYYGGCEFVDVTEQLAIDRAKELFGAEHANVQPHAGAQANLAVFGAFLEPNDPDSKVLGMELAHGGHLTHGSPVNVSGMWFHFIGYQRGRGDRAARHGRGSRPREGASSEDRPRRLHRVPAGDRLRRVPRDRRRGRARSCGSTRPTSSGSSRAAPTRRRFPTPTSSRSPPTRRSGVRAAR